MTSIVLILWVYSSRKKEKVLCQDIFYLGIHNQNLSPKTVSLSHYISSYNIDKNWLPWLFLNAMESR